MVTSCRVAHYCMCSCLTFSIATQCVVCKVESVRRDSTGKNNSCVTFGFTLHFFFFLKWTIRLFLALCLDYDTENVFLRLILHGSRVTGVSVARSRQSTVKVALPDLFFSPFLSPPTAAEGPVLLFFY